MKILSAAFAELGLVVDKACELRDAGASVDEICDALAEYRKSCGIMFAPETPENFVRGGRRPKALCGVNVVSL